MIALHDTDFGYNLGIKIKMVLVFGQV